MMRLKLGTKLMSGFIFLLILIGIVGYFGLSRMNNTVREYNVIVKTNMPVEAHVWELRSIQLEQIAIVRGYMLYKDDKYLQQFVDSNKRISDTYDAMLPLLTTDKSKAFLADFKINSEKYQKNAQTIFSFVKEERTQEATSTAEEARPYVDEIKSITSEWTKWVNQVNSDKVAEVKKTVDSKRT